MTDGESRSAEDDAVRLGATESAVEKWVASNSESFQRAASRHESWARAVEANQDLTERLSNLANVAPVSLSPDMQRAVEALTKSVPDVSRSLDAMVSQINAPLIQALSADAWASLAKSLQGLAGLEPSYNRALRELNATQRSLFENLLPDLKRIQQSLNRLNQPATTRETQQFITGTDSLRFRGNQRAWHYTSAQALDQILKHHVLWASSPHHLNDASELTHGVETVRRAVERAARESGGPKGSTLQALREVTEELFIEDAMHEIYYLSASMASDSLTLWRNYSTADGFAVGLRPGRPLSAEGLIFKDAEADPHSGLPAVASWYRVHYKEAKKNELADSFVSSATKDIAASESKDRALVVAELRKHLLILASTMKHLAFEDEREVRWITTNWAPVDVVHYEVTGRGFVPVLHARSAGFSVEDPHLPISGLRCSPTTSPTIERTIRGLLEQRGYKAAARDVRKSTLPFRGSRGAIGECRQGLLTCRTSRRAQVRGLPGDRLYRPERRFVACAGG